jgi:hypothetical protein
MLTATMMLFANGSPPWSSCCCHRRTLRPRVTATHATAIHHGPLARAAVRVPGLAARALLPPLRLTNAPQKPSYVRRRRPTGSMQCPFGTTAGQNERGHNHFASSQTAAAVNFRNLDLIGNLPSATPPATDGRRYRPRFQHEHATESHGFSGHPALGAAASGARLHRSIAASWASGGGSVDGAETKLKYSPRQAIQSPASSGDRRPDCKEEP